MKYPEKQCSCKMQMITGVFPLTNLQKTIINKLKV